VPCYRLVVVRICLDTQLVFRCLFGLFNALVQEGYIKGYTRLFVELLNIVLYIRYKIEEGIFYKNYMIYDMIYHFFPHRIYMGISPLLKI